MDILVTGSSGTVGSQVVSHLADRQGVTVRAGVRSAEERRAVKAAGNVMQVECDYDNAASLASSCKGVDKMFLLTPFDANQVELAVRLIGAAKAARVKQIVKLSALGAEREPGIQLGGWHRDVERLIEKSGMAWTCLCPNNFMDNFVHFYPPDADGAICLPFGTGACSFIDARDVGAVAATVLTSSGHEGKAYGLTGPQAFTIAQAADTLAEVTGRKITYVDVGELAAKAAWLRAGMPQSLVDAMMELYALDKAGHAAGVTNEVKHITGREPRSFREFARDHAMKWKA
jgi:uncharacterized protein YbjT (DUF2867 family)